MRRLIIVVTSALAVAAVDGRVLLGAGQAAASGPPTIDSLIDIRHPSSATWSPDGRRVAFIWDRAAVQNIWIVDFDDRRPRAPRQLTRHDRGSVPDYFWSRDSASVFFMRNGDLWQIPADGSQPARSVWATPEQENGVVFAPNGRHAAFSRRGDIWIHSLEDGSERKLTDTPAAKSNPVWSPDSGRIAFTVSSSVPRSQSFDYHGSKILFTWNQRTALPDVGVVAVADGRTVMTATTPGSKGSVQWIDAKRLSFQRIDESYKIREVVLADATMGDGTVVFRDVEDKWFNLTYNGAAPLPSPDGRWIAVISDRDGWDHLYTIDTTDGRTRQLTTGERDVSRVAWSADSRRLAFDVDEPGAPGRKQLVMLNVDAASDQPRQVILTRGSGTNTQAEWSPRGDQLLYQRTDARNPADLFVLRLESGIAQEPVRLTDSLPSSIDRRTLVEPQFVTYAASDGKRVPARLFVPTGLDRSRKHPAIVWVHPDGVSQSYDGWHIQRNHAVYYSLHQYLLQKGYVVLAPDFRGSTGYGKEWRLGVHRNLGGQDHRDVAAGVDFLGTLGFVDTARVGVWGLSGGGFLTLQALTLTPTLFRCGINVAGVTDFGDYAERDPAQPFHEARMGSRADNPAQYELAAPIKRVDRLVRPLLVLAPTADTNVPYEQSVRLVDALLKAGKDFDFMMYPGESHYFHREHVLRDAWRRVERFFDLHLREASSERATDKRSHAQRQ